MLGKTTSKNSCFRITLFLVICLLLSTVFGTLIPAQNVMAADSSYITLTVYIVGEEQPFSVTIKPNEYIGNIKLYLQNQTDVDLNQLDLMHDNGRSNRLLLETKNFYYYNIRDGQTITTQRSSTWNFDVVNGVEDLSFTIARPIETNLNVINANSMFGLSPDNESNYAEFQSAMDYCKSNPGTKLVIDPGVYYFRGMTKDFALDNLENILIDGQGSEFIFDSGYCFKLTACNGVEITNLTIDWDWENDPIGSLVRIENVSYHNFDVRFLTEEDVPEDIDFASFLLYDEDEYVPGSYGEYRGYSPWQDPAAIVNKEKIASNVFHIEHNGHMYMFQEGDVYMLRHYVYTGRVFNTVHYSKNITFDNIRIYGFSGMGFVFSGRSNHFQVINSYIGLRPGTEETRRISVAADAIHIVNTAGYFRLDNNDISFNGDDIINVHDDTLIIDEISESRTELTGWVTGGFVNAGDIVRFKTSEMGEVSDVTAVVASFTRDANTNVATITFEEALPENILSGYYVYNASFTSANYVITNNYIHETKGRAALLYADNALFANNYVYRTASEPIHVRAVITSGRWTGGIGTNNVYIENNTFEECNFGGKGSIIEVGISIDGYSPPINVMTNINILNNNFISCIHSDTQNAIDVRNVSASELTISGNTLIDSGIIDSHGILSDSQIASNNSVSNETHTHLFVPVEGTNMHRCNSCSARRCHTFIVSGVNVTSIANCELCGAINPSYVSTEQPTPTPTPGEDPSNAQREQVKAFVARMYSIALERDYDDAGLNYWADLLISHANNGAGIALGFIESQEFLEKQLSDAEYITILYRTFFDREPAEAEISFWSNELQSGKSREAVLAGFVNSTEFNQLSEEYGIIAGFMFEDGTVANIGIYQFTERMYTVVLGRDAETNGLNYWAMCIITGSSSPSDVARLFLSSSEFIDRHLSNEDFVEVLYLTFMGRSSDDAGKAIWVNSLNSNQVSREQVIDGFDGSPEFQSILEAYGLR